MHSESGENQKIYSSLPACRQAGLRQLSVAAGSRRCILNLGKIRKYIPL